MASINNGTINPLFVCTRANYGSGLRAAATSMQMKAFRLNKYENSGEALKCSDHKFELYTVIAIGRLNCMVTTVRDLNL